MPNFALALFALTVSTSYVPTMEKTAFTFSNLEFVHRYSKGGLHEYTPRGQSNLEKWTDMVTVNIYPKATGGDGLAGAANTVLENYKSHGGRVLKTNSVPRTEEQAAEHFIAVLFPQKSFIEAVFARFLMDGKSGCSVVYSHRIYGAKAGDETSAWLTKNGAAVEKSLMAMKEVPVAPKEK